LYQTQQPAEPLLKLFILVESNPATSRTIAEIIQLVVANPTTSRTIADIIPAIRNQVTNRTIT